MFKWNLVYGLWITEPVQKQALIYLTNNCNRPQSYRKWSEKERYEIAKYAAIHGSKAAERKFHTKEKQLSESNGRRFSKLCKEEISKVQKNNRDVNRNLSVLARGRPLHLGSLDQMVQRFLHSLRKTGRLVSQVTKLVFQTYK